MDGFGHSRIRGVKLTYSTKSPVIYRVCDIDMYLVTVHAHVQ